MAKRPGLRVSVGNGGISVWSPELFGRPEPARLREFVARAFTVEEVSSVELRRSSFLGRIRFADVASPVEVWRKLSRALSAPDVEPAAQLQPRDARVVFLDVPGKSPIRITRVGDVLSTWRVRDHGDGSLRLSHPALRNRRDVVFRLEQELAAIAGIEHFQANALSAGVSIRFDQSVTSAERVTLELEKAWPRLLAGLDGPPSRTRLVAAVGLLGLAYTGQYLVPAVRPWALAGVTLYSLPNVVNAAKQLRRGEVGVYALYTTGLAFMLVSGLPFTASVMATFMQVWPHLAHRKLIKEQRRLFAGQRQRPAWAWLRRADGTEIEVNVGFVRKGDLILVRRDDVVPVDGVVEEGMAVVSYDAPFSGSELEDRVPGDPIAAGAIVRDGSLSIRVEHAGTATTAGHLDSLLPQTAFAALPSTHEAERIANRNAKPALALALLSLALTRTLRPSQLLVRPDYITGPRIGAQLTTLQSVATGWQQGVLFRNPAALDRLASADVIVIDESAGLARRSLEVSKVETVRGVSLELLLGYALASGELLGSERNEALAVFSAEHKPVRLNAESLHRHAGVTRYLDALGGKIELSTPLHVKTSKVEVPEPLRPVLDQALSRGQTNGAEALPPTSTLWVLRDDELLGVISFARSGEPVGRPLLAALRARSQYGRIIYLAEREDESVESQARSFDVEFAAAGSASGAKLEFLRNLGARALWVGDGAAAGAREAIAASAVSVSAAPLHRIREEAADVLLLNRGLAALPQVIDLGRAHARRLARDYRLVYAANLLGLFGGFVTGLGALQVGLASNLGTGLVYARHARELDRLAAAAEPRRT